MIVVKTAECFPGSLKIADWNVHDGDFQDQVRINNNLFKAFENVLQSCCF